VILVSAVCFASEALHERALARMTASWGPELMRSADFAFDFSDYYRAEMGSDLRKTFHAFETSIDPVQIVEIKHRSNEIEIRLSSSGKRKVNIDPGYLEAAKLVLASTKNYSHRIYLAGGIYGDVQLVWRRGRFQGQPWTYPDYLQPLALDFFTRVREMLLHR
jgi:hypothetical protein